MSLTKFEDFSNEIFFDIFDYLRPIDILYSFHYLNQRFQTFLYQQQMYIDLSTNISLKNFHQFCSNILLEYSSCIYSIRLSNFEACGSINLFLKKFQQLHLIFPNLYRMIFIEPNENEYRQILNLKFLKSIQIKFDKFYEKEISFGMIFDFPQLQTCTIFYHDICLINKFRSNQTLQRLVLNSFYLNDFHILFSLYPSLQHLIIHQLQVNFHGYLPPFQQSISRLLTLKINCHYTVRFDYIVYLISYFPQLIHLTIIAIGIDFLNSEQWIQTLTSLEYLTTLIFDIKAISSTFNDELSLAFLTGYWRQWQIAVDYSQDNNKFHLYTVPYHRSSFISTIHCLAVNEAPQDAFYSIKDLYLKSNTPMQISLRRIYPNVQALQIYENTIVPINYTNLLTQLHSSLDLYKLVHFELFISMPSMNFLVLLKSIPCLRYFKTDYDILMTITNHFQNLDICSQFHRQLTKFVIRLGILPLIDHEEFLRLVSSIKFLQLNLNSIDDLKQILNKYLKSMTNLLTLKISIVDNLSTNDMPQWQGIMNNISYDIAKKYIKIWK